MGSGDERPERIVRNAWLGRALWPICPAYRGENKGLRKRRPRTDAYKNYRRGPRPKQNEIMENEEGTARMEHDPDPAYGPFEGFELASQDRITKVEGIADDVLAKIFGIDGALVTDESSLLDFSDNNTLEQEFADIKRIYGIDVSDIKNPLLVDVCERIAAKE